ncbi:nitrate- and nitrite sensing domain-containing protein [Kitasatospora sp. NPDC052868]|uniref:nitrate- and nitrite sensing domain-containing protein n=1 Tax=Kitasatospora sp. NPDC052868 TaxID=3364060 RepID=UPI0037CC228C
MAVVPSLALAVLWAVTTGQTFIDFQRQAGQGLLAQKAGQPSNIVYYNLQEERRLSAESLARPGSVTEALRRQRQLTDDAVRAFQTLSGATADNAPSEVRTAVTEARQAMGRLAEQRAAIDRGAVDQPTVFTYYTDLIAVDLRLFTALSHVDNGEVTWISKTLVNGFWAKEMLAREDAILARGWPSGRLGTADLQQVQQAIGAQDHLFTVQVAPYVPSAEAPAWQELMTSPAWQAKASVEQALTRPMTPDTGGTVKLPPAQDQWRQALDQLNPQLVKVLETRTDGIVEVGKGSFLSLLLKVVLTSAIGLIAVIAVVLTTWRLTRSLRRRIDELHTQAEELERTLPEVVERLGHGENVDVEAETRAITAGTHGNGTDELARLGQALNLARTSALETAVRQAEQHRGFERLLQRIARRTQLLIGQQLRKLDELERKHEDPEILEGLFDLDHLTARLRRYEENLVILAGGQPQRRWRKPVPLLDVLRAAQGEVQDYRRIMLDVEGHPWLSERAVGPVAHVIAELMENAATFSKPPTPVEVRAAMVGRGLAVEIEDRGLGMDPAQYDAANALMSSPPRMDVLARADDVRLGFYVVARLAAASGLGIEFRPSAFGGTRVVVLVPDELVIDGDAGLPDAPAVEPIPLARRPRKTALAALLASAAPVGEAADEMGGTGGMGGMGEPTAAPAPPVAPVDAFPFDGPGAAGLAGDRLVPGALGAPGALGSPGVLGSAGSPGSPGSPVEAFAHVEYIQPLEAEQTVQHSSPADGTPYPGTTHGGGGFFGGAPVDRTPYPGPRTPYPGNSYEGSRYQDAAHEDTLHESDPHESTPHDGAGYEGAGHQPVPFADTSYEGSPYGTAPHEATPQGTGTDTPAYPDIAYAKVTPAASPYADEQYRPADNYRLAERRERREYTSTVPVSTPEGGQQPLPQRVRQASLAAELRIPPPRPDEPAAATGTPAAPHLPGTPVSPFQRPVRRSGAAIGAFQRQSRAARSQSGGPDGGHDPGEHRSRPTAPGGPPTPASAPSPWALPGAAPRTTRTDDQS